MLLPVSSRGTIGVLGPVVGLSLVTPPPTSIWPLGGETKGVQQWVGVLGVLN